jgi:methionine-rich copper-binding protein CopC
MNRTFAAAALVAFALAAPSTAFAHAHLVKAAPAVGGTIQASPTSIAITFSEAVEPRFSGIALAAADGKVVGTGPASVDPADHKKLIVEVAAPVQPGSYKVSWHVVSVDTHATQGSFSFELKP